MNTINNNGSIGCEEHTTLVSERTDSIKTSSSIGSKRDGSEPSEGTGARLDACGIRKLSKSFTSAKQWQTIPAMVLQLGPVEGNAQKKTDECLNALEEELALVAQRVGLETAGFEPFHLRLIQLLEEVLFCISTTPLPTEKPQHAPSVIAVFGQQPTKQSVHSQLASYTTIEEWQVAIDALALLKPAKGYALFFPSAVAMIRLRCAEPLDVGKLMSSAAELLAFSHLPGAGLTLADHVQKRREQGLVSELTKAFSIERVIIRLESREKSRIVDVAATAHDTQAINAISDSIRNKPALVVTGESGSGKTVGAMVGATLSDRSFAVYLGAPPPIPAPKESDDAKAVMDEALTKSLTAMLLSSTGLDLANESDRLITVPETSLSIILDELGDKRLILRSFLRLASTDQFVGAIKLTFGVSSVCFIAVGTGCHDILYPAGSRPDSYATVFTNSCDGHAVWRRLVEVGCPSSPSTAPLAPYIFALAGGLEVTGAAFPRPVLDSITRHPEGHVFAATGRALVGNARVAALLMKALIELLSGLWPSAIPTSAPALIECSLLFVRSLHHVAIHQFVALNGLANFPSSIERMECVAKALALTLSCTDAEISHNMFLELCAKKGVLTSHAVEVGNSATPQGGRTFGEGRCWVVPDGERRYRVTEAMASMYLMGFGSVRRPARTGEAFEHVVFEYLTLALAPASIVAEWSRTEGLKPLSLPAPGIARFGLFDLLVEAFAETGVKMGRMLTLMLPSKFEPSRYESSKKQEAGSGIRTLKDVWAALGPEAAVASAGGASVAIVLNGDSASGADIMVLCPGHFAIHLQLKLKLNQTSMMASEDMDCEFAKMGARLRCERAAGSAQRRKKVAARGKARECIEATKNMFPKHYFAIVRCVAPAVAGAAVNQTRAIPHFEGCRYIQVTAGRSGGLLSDAFYPLVSVPTTQTAAALCTPCCYPFHPLPTKGLPATK